MDKVPAEYPTRCVEYWQFRKRAGLVDFPLSVLFHLSVRSIRGHKGLNAPSLWRERERKGARKSGRIGRTRDRGRKKRKEGTKKKEEKRSKCKRGGQVASFQAQVPAIKDKGPECILRHREGRERARRGHGGGESGGETSRAGQESVVSGTKCMA